MENNSRKEEKKKEDDNEDNLQEQQVTKASPGKSKKKRRPELTQAASSLLALFHPSASTSSTSLQPSSSNEGSTSSSNVQSPIRTTSGATEQAITSSSTFNPPDESPVKIPPLLPPLTPLHAQSQAISSASSSKPASRRRAHQPRGDFYDRRGSRTSLGDFQMTQMSSTSSLGSTSRLILSDQLNEVHNNLTAGSFGGGGSSPNTAPLIGGESRSSKPTSVRDLIKVWSSSGVDRDEDQGGADVSSQEEIEIESLNQSTTNSAKLRSNLSLYEVCTFSCFNFQSPSFTPVSLQSNLKLFAICMIGRWNK
jgi:hypothetical protein